MGGQASIKRRNMTQQRRELTPAGTGAPARGPGRSGPGRRGSPSTATAAAVGLAGRGPPPGRGRTAARTGTRPDRRSGTAAAAAVGPGPAATAGRPTTRVHRLTTAAGDPGPQWPASSPALPHQRRRDYAGSVTRDIQRLQEGLARRAANSMSTAARLVRRSARDEEGQRGQAEGRVAAEADQVQASCPEGPGTPARRLRRGGGAREGGGSWRSQHVP